MILKGWTDREGNVLAYEPRGMFTSPDGKEWSNKPYTKLQKSIYKSERRFAHTFEKIIEHLSRTNRTIMEEVNLIKSNKSTLPRYCKDWLLNTKYGKDES